LTICPLKRKDASHEPVVVITTTLHAPSNGVPARVCVVGMKTDATSIAVRIIALAELRFMMVPQALALCSIGRLI
jgi:hypothetical protein